MASLFDAVSNDRASSSLRINVPPPPPPLPVLPSPTCQNGHNQTPLITVYNICAPFILFLSRSLPDPLPPSDAPHPPAFAVLPLARVTVVLSVSSGWLRSTVSVVSGRLLQRR